MFELEIPGRVLADLWVVLLTFGPVLLLGVPSLRKNVRQPAEVELVAVAGDELEPSARRWFDSLDARFRALGFSSIGRWRVVAVEQQKVRMSVWMSDATPAVGVATTLLQESESGNAGAAWLELITELADGTWVGTTNLRRSRFKRKIALGVYRDAPTVRDPGRLLELHQQHVAPYLLRGVRHVRANDFVEVFRGAWRKGLAHGRALGYWRTLADGREGLTLRGAVRMMIAELSPFSGDVGAARLGAVVALALGLSQLAAEPVAAEIAARTGVLVPGHGLLAGIACAALVGVAMPSRAIFWAPIAAWVGLRLGGFELPTSLWFVVGAQLAAGATSSLESRLRTGL